MGLYLCVFASPEADDEVDGVEVGSYEDFNTFRDAVQAELGGRRWGRKFPTLLNQPDSGSHWTPEQAAALAGELDEIAARLSDTPPRAWPPDTWQADVLRSLGVVPISLADSFIDVDGEPLIRRIRELAETAVRLQQPIQFL